jgi:hypothetical protein
MRMRTMGLLVVAGVIGVAALANLPDAPASNTTTEPTTATVTSTPAPPSELLRACEAAKKWSTERKASASTVSSMGMIYAVETDTQDYFDRVIIKLAGTGNGPVNYAIQYVPEVFAAGKDGKVLVAGKALLRVIVFAWDYTYPTNVTPPSTPSDTWEAKMVVAVGSGPSVIEVKHAGTSAGRTTFAVGMTEELGFTASYFQGQLTIDIDQPGDKPCPPVN